MRKKVISIFLFVFLYIVSSHSPVFAEKINSFDVDVVAHKDGKMSVVESINYDFESGQRHGIYRDIPLFSKVGDLYRVIKIYNVSIERDGEKENVDITTSKEQVSFKVGNADKTITGLHNYKISYEVENGVGSNFPEHDEIYWNAAGNNWTVPIESASIKFDSDFDAKLTEVKCFSGIFGSKESDCNLSNYTAFSNQVLTPGQGLTAVAVYPKDTFPPSVLLKELPKGMEEKVMNLIFGHYYIIWIILNLVIPMILIIWYQKHKNKKRFGPPVVNFDIPKDEKGDRIIPALAGTIDTAQLDRDDVVATLFDLAIRRFIIFEEIKTKRSLLPDSKKQKIIKLKDADSSFINIEKTLFDRLFENGDEIYTDELKLNFYKTFQKMEKEVFSDLVKKKYYIKNPKSQRGMFFIFGLIVLILGNFILGGVLMFLGIRLIGRTAIGDEIDFKIDGLKLFLKSMDRNYKWQAEKFYTVEKMIPYAIALGYVDEFMKQLKIINPDYSPVWYHGYSGNFYLAYGAFASSMSSNMTTSAPSSSSGSSGGFSGGGGGGGGGGSW